MTTQLPSAQHILERLRSNNTPNHFPEEHKKNAKVRIFPHTADKKCPGKNCSVRHQKYVYDTLVMSHIPKIGFLLHIEAATSRLYHCKCCNGKDHNTKNGRGIDV